TRLEPAAPLPARASTDPVGLHRLNDGAWALGLGLAFGHAVADALIALASIADRSGARWVRPAPARALLLGPLCDAKFAAVRQGAEQLGFVIDARDPRRRVIACPGAPLCASGLIASRAIAAELAPHLPAAIRSVHVSGCTKGCAHHGPAPLTIVGT